MNRATPLLTSARLGAGSLATLAPLTPRPAFRVRPKPAAVAREAARAAVHGAPERTRLRVIVGRGTSAEAFLASAARAEQTIAIGPAGLWAGFPPDLRMGQPPQLLPVSGRVAEFRHACGKTAEGMQGFMKVGDYQTQLDALAADNRRDGTIQDLPDARVTAVERCGTGAGLVVSLESAGRELAPIHADQVVIATGIGMQQTATEMGIDVRGAPAPGQLLSAIDALSHPGLIAEDVVAYGSGPTAAWVMEQAVALGADAVCITRCEGKGFGQSGLPGGRNTMVLADVARQVRATIVTADFAPHGVTLSMRLPDGSHATRVAQQLVCCGGGNPGAPGTGVLLLAPELASELAPVRDINRLLSDGDGILGLATPAREVLVVGAATYNVVLPKQEPSAAAEPARKRRGATLPAPMATMPLGGQVPSGIAVADAVNAALNNAMPVEVREDGTLAWSLNLATANRTQLRAAYAATTNLDPFAADIAVELIVHFRTHPEAPIGFDPEKVRFIEHVAQRAVERLRNAMPDFEAARLADDRQHGPDAVVKAVAQELLSAPLAAAWRGAGLPA